jgi:hypothetical protein
MDRDDKDLTNEVLKSIYSRAAPGDLLKTFLRYRRGREGGLRLGRRRETTKVEKIETERTLFLLAISEVAPKVLRSLRRVLPVYKRRTDKVNLKRREVKQWGKRWHPWLREKEKTHLERRQVERWSKRYHLTNDWLREVARDTLAMWERNSPSRTALQWSLPYQSVRVPHRMRKIRYPTPMKRARAGKAKTRSDDDPLLHYKWAVMYQCLKIDPDKIAQAYSDADPAGDRAVTTSAIKKAVTKTAHRIGLVLRPGELNPSPGLPTA